MKEILFYIVILLANVIQGITGFAGTILAMPFSLRLVGMGVAVPVLNVLGLLSGIYVLIGNYRHVRWKELGRILIVMGAALVAGILLKRWLSFNPRLLYIILGVLVIGIAVHGLWKMLKKPAERKSDPNTESPILKQDPSADRITFDQYALLGAAGLVHGMFVCGGPLLIGYLTRRIREKDAFRATISVVWIVLNGAILVSQLIGHEWNSDLLKIQLVSVPFLLGGMFIGSLLYKRMSQRFFMLLTYVLLFIAGLTLFFK